MNKLVLLQAHISTDYFETKIYSNNNNANCYKNGFN